MTTEEYIPMDKCEARHVYHISSRNLGIGVYDGKGGFIGIRYKFGNRYLFTEMHHDTGAPYGTVHPREDIGVLPEGIELRENEPTVDPDNGRELAFDKPRSQGGKGWYYKDTGEQKTSNSCPTSRDNKAMFEYLDTIKYEDE